MPLTPEDKAREIIDSLLEKAGWHVCNLNDANIHFEDIDALSRMIEKPPVVTAVRLYGSCAKGENTEDSYVDLWVRVKDVEETIKASF